MFQPKMKSVEYEIREEEHCWRKKKNAEEKLESASRM